MHFKKLNNKYIIRLEKAEEILKTLTAFCEKNNIKAGFISGIGGTDNVSLKYYDLKEKKYLSKTFEGKNFEILSMQGNISLVDNKPFLHIHMTCGDSDYSVFGGHCESAIISITGEIVIEVLDTVLTRKLDEEFQLNFLDV